MHSYVTTKGLKKKAFIVKCENIKQPVRIQLTFFGNQASKVHFSVKCDHLRVGNANFLNHCQDGKVHTYAMTKELKKRALIVKSKNIKKLTGIQSTFMLDSKTEKYDF